MEYLVTYVIEILRAVSPAYSQLRISPIHLVHSLLSGAPDNFTEAIRARLNFAGTGSW